MSMGATAPIPPASAATQSGAPNRREASQASATAAAPRRAATARSTNHGIGLFALRSPKIPGPAITSAPSHPATPPTAVSVATERSLYSAGWAYPDGSRVFWLYMRPTSKVMNSGSS